MILYYAEWFPCQCGRKVAIRFVRTEDGFSRSLATQCKCKRLYSTGPHVPKPPALPCPDSAPGLMFDCEECYEENLYSPPTTDCYMEEDGKLKKMMKFSLPTSLTCKHCGTIFNGPFSYDFQQSHSV